MPVDFTTEHGKRVRRLLDTEVSIWLITVSSSGEPQPNPVWFVWDDDSFLIWSEPHSKRIENIEANPKVAIAFSGDHELHNVTVFNGMAEIRNPAQTLLDHDGYMEKYKDHWEPVGLTAETAAELFTTGIRVRPSRLRGFFGE